MDEKLFSREYYVDCDEKTTHAKKGLFSLGQKYIHMLQAV